MKTLSDESNGAVSLVRQLPQLLAATVQSLPEQAHALERARAFAEPLLASATLDTGENTLAHADAVAAILERSGKNHKKTSRLTLPMPKSPECSRSAMTSRALGTAIFNLPSIFQIADKPFSANEDRPVFLRSLS